MIKVSDIILQIDFESVIKEIEIHHGNEHMEKIKNVFSKVKDTPIKKNTDNMVIFIRVLKENEQGDADTVIQNFDNNDSTLMFDVCGEDDQYDGLYSIASSSDYGELLGYYVDRLTIEKFTYSQITAHILWDLLW